MRVLGVLAGADASARVRIEWPAGANANLGRDVRCAGSGWRLNGVQDQHGHFHSLEIPEVDVLVLQRLQNRPMISAIPYLQDAGVAVVIDIDDLFSAVDPSNPAYAAVHPTTSPDANFLYLAEACKIADLVTVTTPQLAKVYGGHGRVVVLPNRLPAAVLDIERPPVADPPRIGWAGGIDSHPRDLQVVRSSVARVCREHGIQFTNVGPGGVRSALGLDHDEFATGFVPPWEWYPAMAEYLDIAIAPLADTRFNESKSSLKLLEASALGIPCVASPNEDNRRLHGLGMGVLAAKPKEWYVELKRLVVDHGWRREVGLRSTEAARGEVLEDHADDWWRAWTLAREYHESRRWAAGVTSPPSTPAR